MIIAATGHRPDKLGGYTVDVRQRLLALAMDYLAWHPRVSEAVSGMALGWDQAFAHAAVNLGIPFVAAVPFKGQHLNWPPESQAYFHKLLDRAVRVVYVSQHGYHEDAFEDRNQWMVDYSHQVVALWNGSRGGTGNCVAYAKFKGRTITNLWKDWQSCPAS